MTDSISERTTCCVVGGGPAGMMFGFLLARAGVDVTVIEKHRDFFRDFRGDTVHPSTLEVFSELGLLDDFLRLPHQEITSGGAVFGDFAFTIADFSHLRTRCRFVALMPQWDLLEFIATRARQFSNFRLEMEHEATDLVFSERRVTGVEVKTANGAKTIHADLVVACDGRRSTLRDRAGLKVFESGVPIDVLWFRISRNQADSEQLLGQLNYGKMLILINRGDYFQAGLIVRKGSFEQIQGAGLENFRKDIARIAPSLANRVDELANWDQVKLLTVQINRLRQWSRPGLLCIGDAAHAMSPAGGVGINLAIQDAVAAARMLAGALADRLSTDSLLPRVQCRRELPARATQFLQKRAHAGFLKVFENSGPQEAPWQLKLAVRVPGIHRLIGHVIGVGVRPERLRTQASGGRLFVGIACAVGGALAFMRYRKTLWNR